MAAALSLLFLQAVSFHAGGQVINPTVEVTKRFEASVKGIHKSRLPLSFPDSSSAGGPDFSYSVLERKFGVTPDFTPDRYGAVNLPSPARKPVFALDVAGGYPWASYAALDVNIPSGDKVALSIRGGHYGYYGYLDVLSFETGRSSATELSYRSLMMRNDAGVDGSYSWKSGRLDFGAGYYGMMADNTYSAIDKALNSFSGYLGAASCNDGDDYFYYRAMADYGYSQDRFGGNAYEVLKENHFALSASLGPVFRRSHSVTADIDMELAGYGGYREMMLFSVDFTPKYSYSAGRWNLDAGVKFSWITADDASGAIRTSPSGKKNWIFPSVDVRFMAVRDYLWLELSAGGGNAMNVYSDLVKKYPFYDISRNPLSLQYFTSTPYDLAFSVLGSVGSFFSYDLKAGYGRIEGMPAFEMSLTPYMTYSASADYFNACASLSFKSKPVRAGADISYYRYFNADFQRNQLMPPAVTGKGYVEYNWRSRLFVTASALFSGKWGGVPYEIPGWVDLALEVEYRFNDRFSVFAAGNNLLDQTIQYQPLQALPGINFLVGITLNL